MPQLVGALSPVNHSMPQHINNTLKSAYIHARHISSERHFLTTRTLICCLVVCRLFLLATLRLPSYICYTNYKRVQNAAITLVCKAEKSDHIQPILQSLHWLPVTHRIQYKIWTICFAALSGKSPQCLTDLVQPDNPIRKLRSCIWHPFLPQPSCKRKTIWRKIILLYQPTFLEQSALIIPPLWYFFIIQNRS